MKTAAKPSRKTEPKHLSIPAAFAMERIGGNAEPKRVTEHIEGMLRQELAELTAGAPAEPSPAKGTGTFGGFGSAAALERHIAEWKRSQLIVPAKTMDFTVPIGTRIIAPPYDHSWGVGAADPIARYDGTMYVFGDEGFCASGASIVLSSPNTVLASITPQGTFEYAWVSFDNYPSLRSRGGLGLLVYASDSATPVLARQAVVYSVNGVSQYSADKGSGQFSDAVAAMTSFGPVRLGPALVNMQPGISYEVWMWCWSVGQNEKGTAFLSVVQCKVPMVTVDAGPPIVIN